MFDVGWSELLVIGALALIVVGPRDLPQLMRTFGQVVGKVRRMAREFQRSLEDATQDADLGDLKELRDLRNQMSGLDFRKQAAKAARSHLSSTERAAKDGQAETKEAAETSAERPADEPADEPADKPASTPEAETAPTPAAPAAPDAPEKPQAADSEPDAEDATPRRAGVGG